MYLIMSSPPFPIKNFQWLPIAPTSHTLYYDKQGFHQFGPRLMIPTPLSLCSLPLTRMAVSHSDLLTSALDFSSIFCKWRGRRRDVEEVHSLGLLLLCMEHSSPNTMISTFWTITAPQRLFFLLLLGFASATSSAWTLFLWLVVRLASASSILQDLMELLLSPEPFCLCVWSPTPPHAHFLMALTILHFSICFLIHFPYLALSDLLPNVQHLA